MKLYMTPGSCSTGVHILLEECERLFEAHVVNLITGENRSPEFLALNPRGSVPTLVLDDGRVLTDFESIAVWLAAAHPKRRLMPDDPAEAERLRELLRFVVGVIHGEGFTRVFVSDRYADGAAQRSFVEREGRAVVDRAFLRVVPMLRGETYASARFSIADAALFYVEFWAEHENIALPARCQLHFEAMLARPAVRQVLAEEGYTRLLRAYPTTSMGLTRPPSL